MSNCKDCLSNCDPLINDKCTKYTGPDYESLGICKGMSLFEVEKIILDKLLTLTDGTGITLDDLEIPCDFLNEILDGQDKTVFNLVQTLFTAACNQQTVIEEIQTEISTPFSFNTACLTGDLTSRDKILQAVILKVCAVATSVSAISSDYVKQSDLCTQVQACINNTTAQFNSRMVPYAPIPYIGSLSNFDNTGKGLSSAGFDKVYLMNGLNNTQDWRGRSPIGAIQNVPGTTLDSVVDPALPANASYNYTLNQKYGANSTTLTNQQIPSHTHAVVDNGHRHGINGTTNGSGNSSDASKLLPPSNGVTLYSTETGFSNISISPSGGSQAHTNVHPTIACYYIVYLP